MSCTRNPAMSYAAWCDAISRAAAKTGKRIAFGDGTFEAWQAGKTPEQFVATLPHVSEPRKNMRRNGTSSDDFPWDPPPTPDATNANVDYAGRSRVWAWRDRTLPVHRVWVKEPGYLKYDIDVQHVTLGEPIRMVKARVTEVAKDGAKWGWPGERVVRYEAADGSWAWVPGDEKVGDTFEIEAAPPRPGSEVNPARRRRNPSDRDQIIADVVANAAAQTAPWSGSRKVFISDVYQTVVSQGRDDGMTLEEFKGALADLHRKGLVQLVRADLVAAMPAGKVAASEMRVPGAEFHFIVKGERQNPWSETDLKREEIVDAMARTIWKIVAAGADPARRFASPPPAAYRAAQELADSVERVNDVSLIEMSDKHVGAGASIAAVAARGRVRGRRARGDEIDGVVVPYMDVKGTADHRLEWTITHDGRTLARGSEALPALDSGYLNAVARNPSGEDKRDAVDKYEEFHRYKPHHVTELDIKIPRRVRKLGAAKHVLYRSGKVDPSTLKKPKKPVDYIHEHDAGVVVYACDGASDAASHTVVPREFTEVTALTVLGKCLGFALKDGTDAEGVHPLPDLCCTPDGKCLLVVQDRRTVLYMIWGGALGVFARGIDG